MREPGIDRKRLFVLAVCLLSLAIFYPVFTWWYMPAANGLDVTGHPIGRDFINFWAAPRMAFSTQSGALSNVDLYNATLADLFGQTLPRHWWSYPPVVTILLWPLLALPYFWALAVWTALGLGLYAWAVSKLVEPRQWPLMYIFLVLAPASLINMVGGQNGFFTAALFVAGVSLIDRRPVMAGVLLGVLTFKPHLGFALPLALLALQAWRTIGTAIAVSVLLYAASAAVMGIDAWQSYLQVTVPTQMEWMRDFDGFFTSMLVSITAGVLHAGGSFGLAMKIQFVVAALAAITAAWAVWQADDPARRLLVLASATPLCAPWCFNYDLPLLSAAWLIVVLRTGRGAVVGVFVCLVPLIVMRSTAAPFLAQSLLLLGFVWSLRLACSKPAESVPLTVLRA